MTYSIEFSRKAAKVLRTLPGIEAKKISRKIDKLATDPRPRNSKKMVGAEDLYRIRSGDYRVIYQIEDRILHILIVSVGNRKDIYR